MLNTISNNSKTIINTPASGILQKSNNKSFFLRFHQKSRIADKIFHHNPMYENMQVVVIQTLLLGEGEMLCELIKESDYNQVLEVKPKE